MKKVKRITNILMVTTFMLLASSQINAQNFNPPYEDEGFNAKCKMLNLTDDQQTKINELKTAHMKEMLQLKNRLNELKAKQQTLTTTEKADMKAINANIDEITALKNKMMKQKAQHQQDVRALLTDEQRVIFDSHMQGRKCGTPGKFEHKKGQGCKNM